MCMGGGEVGDGWRFRARRDVEPMCKACIDSKLFIQLYNSFLLLVYIHSVRSLLGVSILPPFDIPEAGVIRCYWINGFAQGALSFESSNEPFKSIIYLTSLVKRFFCDIN